MLSLNHMKPEHIHPSEYKTPMDDMLQPVIDLLAKYRMYSKSSEAKVVSGGLQQYLIRQLKVNKVELTFDEKLSHDDRQFTSTMSDNPGNRQIHRADLTFSLLPVNLKLHIFSFLSSSELCQSSRVCHNWKRLTEDQLLWRRRLVQDIITWNIISHTTNPSIYTETQSEWTDKEIYFKCCPQIQSYNRSQFSTFLQVSNLLKSLFFKKVPRIAMFGPGLESSTSGIVRNMMYSDTPLFERVGMFPGQFDGYGSGMTLKLRSSGSTCHLTVLYSSTKHEREANPNRNRLATSKLLHKIVTNNGDEDIASYELVRAVKDLCHTLDAFVFVVDALDSIETVKNAKTELMAIVNERWLDPSVPVLVLLCIPECNSQRLPAVRIVEALNLGELNRPWMVQNVIVDQLIDVESAMQWIVDMSNHK